MTRPNSEVAVIGASGWLGSPLVVMLAARRRVRAIDRAPPSVREDLLLGAAAPVEAAQLDICRIGTDELATRLAGCDSVVHLAGLHGAHLTAGRPRREVWEANFRGTANVVAASEAAGVRRLVLASSTSVYGSGTAPGHDARILDEDAPVWPEDVYDAAKLACERLVLGAGGSGTGVVLRLGRFFLGAQSDYHLRKLSTGLDLGDACQAVVRVLEARLLPRRTYCVASDLPLEPEERRMLGHDLPGVVARHVPRAAEVLAARGHRLPARVGKSVDTAGMRADLGYRPRRTFAWWIDSLGAVTRARPREARRGIRHAPLLTLTTD